MATVNELRKKRDELKTKINTSTDQQASQQFGKEFVTTQRSLKEAERAEKDLQFGNNPNYKREIFPWEKQTVNQVSSPQTQATIRTEQPLTTIQPDQNTEQMLREQSQSTTDSLVAEIRNRINQAKSGQQDIIRRAPQQFDPLRSQSEVAKSQQLRTALERASIRGDRGGIGRSEALATQTAGENRLNQINLAQQNVIDDANAEIARLESQGQLEEARVVEAQKAQLLQNLLGERQRQEEIDRADRIRQEGIDRDEQARQRDQFVQTIGRFSQDFQAEINRVANDGDPSNDWQIPLLQTARQEKIAGIEQQDFQTELANIGQYSQDYQAEINRREAINPNDPLLPYLRSARQQKIAGIEAGQAEQARIQEERDYELFLRDLDVQDKATLMQYENELEQSNKLLDAEIQSIRDEQRFVQDSALKTQLFEQEQILMDRKAQNDRYLQAIKDSSAMDRILASDQAAKEQIVLREELKGIYDATDGGLPLDTIEQAITNEIGRMPNAEINQLMEDYKTAASSTQAKNIADRIKFLREQDPNENQRKLSVMTAIAKNDSWFDGVGGEQKLMSILATNGIDPEVMKKFMEDFDQLNPFGGL